MTEDKKDNSSPYSYRNMNNLEYRFMSIPEVFSEIFNYALKQDTIDPATLKAVDSRETANLDAILSFFPGGKENKRIRKALKISLERFRDIKMLGETKDGGKILYVCMENQSEKEDDMRERINLYNAISYLHAKNSKGRIMVVTCCVGWGSESFETDMYAFDDYGENMEPALGDYLPHYRIPVVNIKDIPDEDAEAFSPDLKAVVKAVKLRETEFHGTDDEYYKGMEELMKLGNNIGVEAKLLIYAFCGADTITGEDTMGTGLKDLIEYGNKKNFAEGKTEGKIEGKIEGKVEGKAEIISKLMEKMGCSFDSACEYLSISNETKEEIAAFC